LDTAIAERIAAIPHTLDTIPGFGAVFSASAEIAGIERFDYNQTKVAKYAGLKWRQHQSGKFEAEEIRLARTGNRYLRYSVRPPMRFGYAFWSIRPIAHSGYKL